jgi:hypothetical protein
LISAVALAAGWWVCLSLLALFTANPVTLNREQILRSKDVVTGTIVGDPGSGKVSVTEEWKGHDLRGTIMVANLATTIARQGTSYLIPLSASDETFRVTETLLPNGAPLIYPATYDALEQLQEILRRTASPAPSK